jgi:hypothetical protein
MKTLPCYVIHVETRSRQLEQVQQQLTRHSQLQVRLESRLQPLDLDYVTVVDDISVLSVGGELAQAIKGCAALSRHLRRSSQFRLQ